MKIKVSSKLEFPEVRIVEASAGSGKTYTLAKRYLQLLLNYQTSPQGIKNILAITFTNMAMREMKERILELLKKIALNKFSSEDEKEDLLSTLPMEKKDAWKKAYALMDYIIRNYNFFQVQTIDSFINIILSGCAYRIGLSADFRIKQSYQEYLLYSLDECIERANYEEDVRKVFDDFLNQYIYIEVKKSWFPKKDILNLMDSLLYHTNIYGGEFKKFPLKSQELVTEKRRILELLKELEKKLPKGVNARFSSSLKNFLRTNAGAFDYKNISKYFRDKKFPINKGYPLPRDVERLWNNISGRLAEIAEKEARALFNCYIDIFTLVYEGFRKYANFEDILFLGELNRQAMVLLGRENITVPELYYRLATRFQHYLIDEFQDTSTLQWQNLFLMIEDALSTGGSLFYVGDKKQAIYRFRGGEVSLFDRIKEDFKIFNVKSYPLNVNYRSQKEIVEFNNMIFSQENLCRFFNELSLRDQFSVKELSREDITEIIDIFRDSKQSYRRENCFGYVKVEPVEVKGREEQEKIIREKLLSLIKRLTQRFRLRDIAVLSRKNKEVELVSSWLIENNIAVESEKTLDLRNNHLIKELVSLLKFLNSPIDNLSFSSFLLGEIFTRATAIRREEMEDFIFKHRELLSGDKPYYLYRDFRKSYPWLWQTYIEDFFKAIGFIGLYELSVSILQRFRCFENFERNQGFFMHLLELIKKKEEDYLSIGDFLDYFENSQEDVFYVHSSDADAVKVMSIHKAKGLGFPVVIIPFLNLNIEVGSHTNRGKVSYVVSPQKNHLELLRLDRKYANFSPFVREVYHQEYKKAFIDELNTIYVAFTRPKYELYVFIPYELSLREKVSKNIAKLLIPSEYYQRGKRIKYKIPEFEEDTLPSLVPLPVYREWINYLKDEFIPSTIIENRREVVRGEVLHFILSCIGNLKNVDRKEVLEKSLVQLRLKFPYLQGLEEMRAMVERVLNAPQFKQFFYLEEGEVYQEKEVVDREGRTKRIDRLIVKKEEVWVLDYKSSLDTLFDYRTQIQEYITLIRELYPDKKVKGYLIFLDKLCLEEIDG